MSFKFLKVYAIHDKCIATLLKIDWLSAHQRCTSKSFWNKEWSCGGMV